MQRNDEKQGFKFLLVILVLFVLGLLLATNRFDFKSLLDVTPLTGLQATPTGVVPTRTPAPQRLTPTPQATPTRPATLQAADPHGREVIFWHPWGGDTGRVIRDLVREFNTTNEWGIIVRAANRGTLDEVSASASSAVGTQAQPDVLVAYPYQALQWDGEEALVDLDPYIHDPSWGIPPEKLQDYFPVFWESNVVKERRFGVPAQRSGQYLFYNQTWARELGFDEPPSTLQDFKDQACAAAQSLLKDEVKANDRQGGAILTNNYPAALGWINAFGGEVVNSTQTGYQFNTASVREVFRFLRELYDQGCAWYDEDSSPEEEFASRLGLFAPGSLLGIPYQKDAFSLANNRDQWTLIPFPSPNEELAVDTFGPSYIQLESSPEQQLATWLFVRWLLEPEQQNRLVQAAGSLPLQKEVLVQMGDYDSSNPQWQAAVSWLPVVKSEPSLGSWGVVRWALSDAMIQLTRSYFTAEQVPDLAKLLDDTARELNQR